MTYNPERHHRRSIRLKGYDYTQPGAYFVTIVAQDRACLFGEIVDGEMRLNDAGRMLWAEWQALPQRFPTIALDAFVVMPNHVHGIIIITNADNVGAGLVPAPLVPAPIVPAPPGATTRVAPTDKDAPTDTHAPTNDPTNDTTHATTHDPTIGDIVGAFKSITTVMYTRGVKQSGWPAFRGRLWQRNYYERIVRDDVALRRIRAYIHANPSRWERDGENHAIHRP